MSYVRQLEGYPSSITTTPDRHTHTRTQAQRAIAPPACTTHAPDGDARALAAAGPRARRSTSGGGQWERARVDRGSQAVVVGAGKALCVCAVATDPQPPPHASQHTRARALQSLMSDASKQSVDSAASTGAGEPLATAAKEGGAALPSGSSLPAATASTPTSGSGGVMSQLVRACVRAWIWFRLEWSDTGQGLRCRCLLLVVPPF